MLKKKLFLLFLVAVFAACSGDKKAEQPLNSTVFIEQKLNGYLAENADWAVEESESEATDKFKRQAIKWSNEPDFLKDMPLQLTAIKDTVISEQAVKLVVFKNFKDASRLENSLLNDIGLQINGIFSADQIKDFAMDKKYTLKGMLFKQGKRADVKVSVSDEKPFYNIGTYTFWNLETKAL
jgi:ABC-type glycerol-3-phosphate transport system substrate-binding protein